MVLRRHFLRAGSALLLAPLASGRERLLDEVERRACRYFYDEADPSTGLALDRARMRGPDPRRVASIAATGFALSALAIAHRRGWLGASAARSRAARTLDYLARRAPHHHGFYYHFLDAGSGQRVWQCELSSIDTAWLLCGVLHARAHFDTPEIERLSAEILDRVDWTWMLNGGETLSHGWTPERGFLPYRWDSYSELLAMYLLAVGSRTSPIPRSSWHAWKRPRRSFRNLSYIGNETPLFMHQYSHAWFDFRGHRDQYADYFENSRLATQAHRLLCMGLSHRFPWYGADMWGVTASDSPRGYCDWNGGGDRIDGTLAPCAAGGSLPFLPGECTAVLQAMLDRYGDKVWGCYGFVDAFHPRDGWYSPDVIGIDLGIMLLMAENARSGAVWAAVMSTPEAQRGLAAVEM